MKLELEIARNTATVQESIPLAFRLYNDGPDTEVPFEYDSTDVLTLLLSDDDGNEVCRANGYDRMMRQGLREPRVPHAEHASATLPAGKIMAWENDLLLFMDMIEPGHYFVEAEFKFQPSGIEVRSERVALEVTPSDPKWVDVVDDYVSIGMTYTLQRTLSDGNSVGLMRIASISRPTTFWKGGTIPLPPDAEPYISEVDHFDCEAYNHDMIRWIVWLTDDTVKSVRFNEKAPEGFINEYSLGDGNWEMVGRPVQHRDLGVSIVVANRLDDRTELKRLDFSDTFELLNSFKLLSLAPGVGPIATAVDWSGRGFIAYAEEETFSFHLVEFAKEGDDRREVHISKEHIPAVEREINAGNNVRVGALRVSAKELIPGSRAFMIAAVSEGVHGQKVLLCRLPVDAGTVPGEIMHIDEIMLPRQALDADERFTGGAIAGTGQSGLHAVLITSRNRLFHITKGVEPKPIADTGESDIAAPGPLLTTLGDIHLFFTRGDGRGIFHRAIFLAPLR